MSNLVITNTFVALAKIKASEHNTNWSDAKTWLNNRDNGTDYWLNMIVHGSASNPAEIKSSNTACELDIDCTGSNGTPLLTWRRSGTTYFTMGVDGADSNKFKFGTTSLTTNNLFRAGTGGNQMLFSQGSAGSPGISFFGTGSTGGTGVYSDTSDLLYLSVAGTGKAVFATQDIQFFASGSTNFLDIDGSATLALLPRPNNTWHCGNTSFKWVDVWAVNGTIQTSISSSKVNIAEVSDDQIKVPQAITFNRPEDKHQSPQLGFLADDLPAECFAVIDDQGTRSETDVYTSGVIGILCAAYKKLEARIGALEGK